MANNHHQRRLRAKDETKSTTGEVELTETSAKKGVVVRNSVKAAGRKHGKRSYSSSRPTLMASMGIKAQTIQAAGILMLAIGTSLLWNRYSSMDPGGGGTAAAVQHFLNAICSTHSVYCHKAMAVASQRRRRRREREQQTQFKFQQQQQQKQQRTLAAIKGMVQRHETVLEIPRHLTIWDLDALRDPWIQKELLMASAAAARTSSGTADTAAHSPPPAAAFLAVYVALRMFGVGTRGGTSSNNNNNNAAVAQQQQEHNDWVKENPILHEYLSKILPNTLGDFEFHPMLWSDEELEELLGTYTSTYDHVVSVRRSVQQEYRGFLQASTDFASRISYEQYQIARLNVMTRSFGTGKLLHVSDEASEQEIAQYQRAGVDLSNGCHAMVPVLDQFNHHGSQPNVGFSYQAAKRAFVVTAVRAIPAGAEIFDSYGKRTDSDLFARYGFVNGDGSEYTQASLALWHHVDPETAATSSQQQIDQHLQTPQWKMAVLRYLQYDDGYESCVIPPQQSGSGGNSVDDNTTAVAVAWELKRTKYEHLLFTGHSPQRWVVRMPPRNIALLPPDGASSSSSSSSSSSQTIKPPPVFDMRKLQFDGSWLFSTCRLIVLTHDDYDGGAFELLQANVHNTSFFLPPPTTHQRDALEFRTLMCIARMAQTALGRYGVTLQQQLDHVSALHHHGAVVVEAYDDNNHTTTATLKNWTVAHLRLGEMQTLEALKQTAFTGLRLFQDKINSEPAFSMRDNPCPLQALQPLFENTVQ